MTIYEDQRAIIAYNPAGGGAGVILATLPGSQVQEEIDLYGPDIVEHLFQDVSWRRITEPTLSLWQGEIVVQDEGESIWRGDFFRPTAEDLIEFRLLGKDL